MATITINKNEWARISDSASATDGNWILLQGLGIFASMAATANPIDYEDGRGNFLKRCNVNDSFKDSGEYFAASTSAELWLYALSDIEIDIIEF